VRNVILGEILKDKKSITGIFVIFVLFSTIPALQAETTCDDTPPTIEIMNPTEGYFHFSGIKLFQTKLDIVSDTMGFGGFRVRPVQVEVEDDVDAAEDIQVYMYVYEDEQGEMIYNSENNLHERQWIGPDLGDFVVNISAEDTTGNVGYVEMDVWYFCFIPE